MTTSFRLANPLVYEQIRKRAGALITDVDSTTRRAVVEMVKQFTEGNYAAGASMPQLAREIRAGIGMHPTHAKTWWMDHRRRLIDNGMSGAKLGEGVGEIRKEINQLSITHDRPNRDGLCDGARTRRGVDRRTKEKVSTTEPEKEMVRASRREDE